MNRYFLFFIFTLLPLLSYAQHTIDGKLTDEKHLPLPDIHILLYHSTDTINSLAITVSDSLGCFLYEAISNGEYILKFRAIGMITKTIPLPINNTDVHLGEIQLQTDNYVLNEVNVEAKIPEWTIIYRPTIIYGAEISWVGDDKLIPTYITDETNYKMSSFEGCWQWKSVDCDTIFTVELVEVERVNSDMRSHPVESEKRKYPKKITKMIFNQLVGRYEYQVGDSILFSSMHIPIKMREAFSHSINYKQRGFLFSDRGDLMKSDKYVYLRQAHNPFGKHRAFITFTFLNAEQNMALWEMDVLKSSKEHNRLVIRKAVKGDFVLPNNVVMHRIEKVTLPDERTTARIVTALAEKFELHYLIKNKFTSNNAHSIFKAVTREEADKLSSTQVLEIVRIELKESGAYVYAKNYADKQTKVFIKVKFQRKHKKWVFKEVTTGYLK